jgi:hypothetical protein
MKGTMTQTKAKVAGVALALVLLAPAAAHATSKGDHAARATAPVASTVAVPQGVPVATHSQGPEFGWPEATIGAGICIGILLLGLWGDVAVGAVIMGAAALVGGAATLGRSTSRTLFSSTRRAGAAAPKSSTSSA